MKRCSLAAVCALWTGIVLATSTAVFTLNEYLSPAPMRASDLLREDAWRVVAATALVYLVLWTVIRRVVLRPIHDIDAHLYRVGLGRLEPLVLHSHVRELQAIADGVNLMVRRMEMDLEPHALEDCQRCIDELRTIAHALPSRLCDDEAEELLRCASALQAALGQLFQTPVELQSAQPASGSIAPSPERSEHVQLSRAQ